MLTQGSNASCDASNSEHDIKSRIPVLVSRRGPTNVGWFVIPVYIHSINSPSFFPRANIFKKALEGFPSLANRNPSASIKMVMAVVWTLASSSHGFPYPVDSGFGHAVAEVSSDSRFPYPATARFCPSVFQVDVSGGGSVSTFANAHAHSHSLKLPYTSAASTTSIVRGFCNYFKLSECQSDERFSGRHNVHLISDVVFSGGRPATTGAHCDYGTT